MWHDRWRSTWRPDVRARSPWRQRLRQWGMQVSSGGWPVICWTVRSMCTISGWFLLAIAALWSSGYEAPGPSVLICPSRLRPNSFAAISIKRWILD
mmetsp:Transcript_21291/g.52517  ORF Transcript_21291/g.52517 Transcript_21291/m.52517 type:complete len:96 (-) Transcript_21291:4717-5004(-)